MEQWMWPVGQWIVVGTSISLLECVFFHCRYAAAMCGDGANDCGVSVCVCVCGRWYEHVMACTYYPLSWSLSSSSSPIFPPPLGIEDGSCWHLSVRDRGQRCFTVYLQSAQHHLCA